MVGFNPGMLRNLVRSRYQYEGVMFQNKNPELLANGLVRVPITFEVNIDVRSTYGRSPPHHYIPHLVNGTVDEVFDGIGKSGMVKAQWEFSKRAVSNNISGSSDERTFELLTQEMTKRVTGLEHACLLLYSSVFVQEYIKNESNLKESCNKLATEFEDILKRTLGMAGYDDSRLMDSIKVEGYFPPQVKPGKYKMRIRLGVILEMMAYGFILDAGREATGTGKHVPYKAIYDWCVRSGITPKGGKSFSEMVRSIRWKIDEFGYLAHPFIDKAFNWMIDSQRPEYVIWQKLNNTMDSVMKKAAIQSKKKYKGFGKRIGKFTLRIK